PDATTAHRIPSPRVVTIMIRPSGGTGWAEDTSDLRNCQVDFRLLESRLKSLRNPAGRADQANAHSRHAQDFDQYRLPGARPGLNSLVASNQEHGVATIFWPVIERKYVALRVQDLVAALQELALEVRERESAAPCPSGCWSFEIVLVLIGKRN